MAYNYEYPYFDSGQFNVDWLLATIKKIEEELSGTKTYDYKGVNEVLDLNALRPNSMASFTENFNVLNAPISGVRRFVFTNGSETGGFQRCYDLSIMEVYSRTFTITNGTYIWKSWAKTENRPGTNLHSTLSVVNGNMNDLESNTCTLVNGNTVQNSPTHDSGFVITWKSIESSSTVQLWFNISNSFVYIRFFTGNWSAWKELNHIDFTNYYKATTVTDLNSMISPGSAFINMSTVANGPVNTGYFQVLTLGAHGGMSYQIAYNIDNRVDIYTRRKASSNAWGAWGNVLLQPSILHRSETLDGNEVIAANYYTGLLNKNQPENYAAIIGLGGRGLSSDQYQIAWTNTNNLYLRYHSSKGTWTHWIKFQQASTREALLVSSLPYNISTDDEGRERVMIEENMYSGTAADSNSEYLNCPGQSLFHADTDAHSYTEAILSRDDLQTFDSVITNLEQWDMDIPLPELVEKTRAFVEQLQAVNPLADIIILSVPPIDVPFLGEELYSYTYPSGNTLTEVDDALTALAQELGFSYITWKEYKHINHTNLLTFYDNLYEEPVYKRSLETYVSRQVKNCIE